MNFYTLYLEPDTPSDYTGTIQIGCSDKTPVRWFAKLGRHVIEAAIETGFSEEHVSIEIFNVEKEKRKRGTTTHKKDPFENGVVDRNRQLKFKKKPKPCRKESSTLFSCSEG